MINIDKLRRLALDGDLAAMQEIVLRLEAAEKERDWHAERCEDAMDECARLHSKIEAIERQEPVKYEKRIKLRSKHTWGAWWECDKSAYVKAKAAGGHYPKFSDDLLDYEMRPLYTLPGVRVGEPAPSVPEGFSREDLEAAADGLDGYEKTVNVGNVTGEGDDHLESTTAYAARFIRAMLAAPESNP